MNTKNNVWKRDSELLKLKGAKGNIVIPIGQVLEGVMVLGGVGSGKTSRSLNTIQKAMMEKGFGMLNCCVKADEADRAKKLAQITGRGDDVRVMKLDGSVKFNILEALRLDGRAKVTNAILQISEPEWAKEGCGWAQAAHEHLNNLVWLFILAGEKLDISAIRLALDDAQVHKKLLTEAAKSITKGAKEEHELLLLTAYFLQQWTRISEKTRESILTPLKASLSPFCNGPMRDIFCTDTTFDLKELREGKILIVDIPCVGENAISGIAANKIMKFMVEQMIENTKIVNESIRPVIIVADDCHYVTTSYDAVFATCARSVKGGLFFLTTGIDALSRTPGILTALRGLRVLHSSPEALHQLITGARAAKVSTYIWFREKLSETHLDKIPWWAFWLKGSPLPSERDFPNGSNEALIQLNPDFYPIKHRAYAKIKFPSPSR
ncbi:MAG: type IV secretory system conjugative DNA transfer family protein [Chthoniobacterales bacterium]|nr:type IV secretory system conjugative DNA transfer family protein [Chthoniobacterales bacterium]